MSLSAPARRAAHQFIERLEAITTQSRTQLDSVVRGVGDIQAGKVSSGIGLVRAAQSRRELLLSSVRELAVPADGTHLKALLIRALTLSVRSDRTYEAWGKALVLGQAKQSSHEFARATTIDRDATAAKLAFLIAANRYRVAHGIRPLRENQLF